MVNPNAASAIIAPEKLRDYLLSPTHPIGRYKSVFFRSLGYSQELWENLGRDLRGLLGGDAVQLELTEHGQKVAFRGSITGPNGRSARVATVWIILTGENVVRFVTAYPED
jgi:hypothetical protein